MKNVVCHIVSVLYNCLNDQKENLHPHTSSAWCVMQKHIWGQSNAAWKQRSQPLEGYKIYLLSAFLFLLYLIKKAILLSHLLSDLPCQDPERAIHHLSLSYTPFALIQNYSSGLLLAHQTFIFFCSSNKNGSVECYEAD